MGNGRQLASVLLLSACAAATGCAQWQQDPDLAAASFDDRVLAKFVAILGEPSPPASLRRVAAKPTNVHLASAAEPVMPLTDDVEAPAAEPIANAATPRLAAPAPYGDAARSAVQHCDACCDAHSPGDATCPALAACGHCDGCLAGRRCRLLSRPEPGPPPIRYQPCLPPKFLPVPTQPVLSPARPDAPDPWRGDVEVGWRTQVSFPARD